MGCTVPRPSVPASRPLSHNTLKKWERTALDQTYMCNQTAAFIRCLTKVQENMSVKGDTECYFQRQALKQATPVGR